MADEQDPRHEPHDQQQFWYPVNYSQQTGPGMGTDPRMSAGPSPSAGADAGPGAAPGTPPVFSVGTPASETRTATRKGPGWISTTAIALACAVLASGATFGAVRLTDGGTAEASSSSSSTSSGGLVTGSSSNTSGVPVAASSSDDPDWSKVASAVSPSTVSITVTGSQGEAEGTGIVYDKDGRVITNDHVVEALGDGAQISVAFSDGSIYSASVLGTDSSTDLAVLKLDSAPDSLTPAVFADSSSVAVGQDVMALGNPLGLENTVTTGIISAVNRPVVTESTSSEQQQGQVPGMNPQGQQSQDSATYTSAIQTDASINPGNSGGPLVDAKGQVIGINSSIASNGSSSGEESSSSSGSIGLGFAIPANLVTSIADQLIKNGSAEHALLGVTAKDATAKVGDAEQVGAQIVETTSGGPAESAGLTAGDVITKVDGVSVAGATALTAYVRSLPVDSTHKLTYVRDGAQHEVDVTLSKSGS